MIIHEFFMKHLGFSETQAKEIYFKIKNHKFTSNSGILRLNEDTLLQKIEFYKNNNGKKSGFIWLYITVISWAASIGLWVWFIIRKVFENSVGYIRLAYESLSRADAYLTHTVIILVFAIILTVLAIGFTLVFVLVRIRKKKKA